MHGLLTLKVKYSLELGEVLIKVLNLLPRYREKGSKSEIFVLVTYHRARTKGQKRLNYRGMYFG